MRATLFELNSAVYPRDAWQALAAACDGRSSVLGIGQSVIQALGGEMA
jgi:hypothetical protein